MKPCLFDKEKHFAEYSRWYDIRGERVPIEILPEFGIIIPGFLAGFIFHDKSSKLAFIHGVASNPEIKNKFQMKRAISLAWEFLIHECESRGIKILYFTTGKIGLARQAARVGFIQTAKGVREFVKPL